MRQMTAISRGKKNKVSPCHHFPASSSLFYFSFYIYFILLHCMAFSNERSSSAYLLQAKQKIKEENEKIPAFL
jgi:hypothetical protein